MLRLLLRMAEELQCWEQTSLLAGEGRSGTEDRRLRRGELLLGDVLGDFDDSGLLVDEGELRGSPLQDFCFKLALALPYQALATRSSMNFGDWWRLAKEGEGEEEVWLGSD